MNPIKRYSQAQSATASPERIMVLLFEAALRNIRAGAQALESGEVTQASRPLSNAAEIVAALDGCFDPTRFPALARNLGSIYRFVCQRLVLANLHRDAGMAREAERVFFPVADAFSSAVEMAKTGTR
ncbi:MAG TPA: flagellar export chaperone FliS [Anaeromyxobacteraceae bacterium]|nr:flagellar export chaperone FliS [Anaeromyxobacteraceae bacterium]